MSVEIWPHIAPDQLKIEEDATQARELSWFLASLRTTLRSLKRGLEDSYALLAPIDPGSTLVLSTPRNETVKGHVTRVGTRLVKGTVHLRLRTLPPQTLSLDPGRPIRIAPLVALNTLLTESIDLVGFCVEEDNNDGDGDGDEAAAAAFLSSQLRLLAQHLAEAFALIKGSNTLAPPPPPAGSDERGRDPTTSSRSHLFSQQPPSTSAAVAAAAAISGPWTRSSVPLGHFAPPLSRNLSFYLTVQDASLVLYLRALEPAGAPMNFGAKLAFAIGTARRLEHDEADRVFAYRCDDDMDNDDNNHHHHNHHQQQQLDVPKEEYDNHNNRNRNSNDDDDVHLSVAAAAAPRSSSSRRRPVSAGSGGSHATSVSLGSSFGFGGGGSSNSGGDGGGRNNMGIGQGGEVEVYVREKVRVESADPSLLSLSAKLGALANTLSLARRNLAAVMGEEFEESGNYVGM
ncbi:37S ribosomal protein rsm22 [Biscogniauxia mediterranea]|nr:37S ribosomal protein rsm22 [Biscogniauxia mediterranea]